MYELSQLEMIFLRLNQLKVVLNSICQLNQLETFTKLDMYLAVGRREVLAHTCGAPIGSTQLIIFVAFQSAYVSCKQIRRED
jgi:hypothetical protein